MSRRPSARVLVVVLSLALFAALVALGLLWREYDAQRDRREAAEAAERAAREAVVEMTTYDHTTVDEDFAWVEEAGTEKFQDFFADASAPAIELIKQVRATAEGEVVESAAVVEDEEHVTVLLFVDQTIASADQDGAKVDQPRVTMQMVEQGGEWLVDEVQVNNLLTD